MRLKENFEKMESNTFEEPQNGGGGGGQESGDED